MSTDSGSAAGTKYGDQISESWRWECESGVRMSHHAAERWDERTPAGAVAPETAWECGLELDERAFGFFSGRTDSARTFAEAPTDPESDVEEPYQAILIERDGQIVTTLTRDLFDGPIRAYFNALLPQIDHQGGEHR